MKFITAFIVTLFFCYSLLESAFTFSTEIDGGKVVQVRSSKHRIRQDVRSVTFKIKDKDYHFNFVRSNRSVYSNNIPVYLVKSKPGSTPNYTYERVPNTDEILSNGFFYVDNEKKAVAYVHYDEKNRDIIYNGLFGENSNVHLIKSLSENQKYQLQRLHQEGNQIIYEAPRRSPYLFSIGEQEKRTKRSSRENPLKVKSAKPLDILYPKLLVLVDNALFENHNRDISSVLQYIATFWNAVDQKYIELDAPKVQLSVTGVIIADDENATFNFVQQGKLDPEIYGKDRWYSHIIFESMRMYFHHNFSKDVDFQNYDAAVLMTAVDIRPYVGQTYSGKICGDWYNEIIVRDQGWFDGVHTATHELAHALGVEHEKYRESGECPSLDGKNGVSVMSPIQESGDYFFWSDCTKRSLKEFATVKAAECLATRHRIRKYAEDNWW